jgi:hypothetical protein
MVRAIRERRARRRITAHVPELPHRPEAVAPAPPSEHEQLIAHLERDQLVAATFTPVPRARLSPRLQIALWLLRAFVIVVGVMVIYTFIARL